MRQEIPLQILTTDEGWFFSSFISIKAAVRGNNMQVGVKIWKIPKCLNGYQPPATASICEMPDLK
jgi:hypothetical protein